MSENVSTREAIASKNRTSWSELSCAKLRLSYAKLMPCLQLKFRTRTLKTPKEALYLETGRLPLKYVVMQRRLMYLHDILSKSESDLIRKVY